MFDFKGLINALLRKKSDDPVGNLKSATIWVQELPQSDIQRALQEILKALAKLQKNTATPLPERLRVLLYLDEKASGLQHTLCRDYLRGTAEGNKDSRHKLHTILLFWDAMADAYYDFIRAYSKEPLRKLKKQLPLVTAKAMHFLAMQAKWRYLRYLPTETHTWRRLGRLYLFAEREGFKDHALHLYPHQPDTSCAREYLRALLLYLANPGSLQPEQIEMVDQWLVNWSHHVEIESGYRPHRQNHAINLEDAKPPRKLRRNMVGEKYRYWSVSLLILHIGQLIAQLQEGTSPARLKLGEDCRLPECLEFLDEIAKRWSGEASTRKHERVAAENALLVVEGLHNIISRIQKDKKSRATTPLSPGAALYASIYLQPKDSASKKEQAALPSSGEPDLFEPATLQLTTHNESPGGLGASFTSNGEDKLRLGSLIALKKPDSKQFSIGVVRRLSKEPNKQVHLGIQIWTPTPIVVNLSPVQKEGRSKSIQALYLPEYPELHLGRSLLMPSEIYAPGKQLTIMAQGKSYVISLQQAAAQSREYTRAAFEVVKRARAA